MKPAVIFDGYVHSVTSSHADLLGVLLLYLIVASDVNVAVIHVSSATGSSQTLRYRFRCHTRFAAKRLIEYITCASDEFRMASATEII